MIRISLIVLAGVLVSSQAVGQEGMPRSLDPAIKIELFAESPEIVTPTGIDVDSKGRVWAIESNTHFPPEGYSGHTSDRVLVMQDTNGDGKADEITQFADGLRHAMSVAVKPVWLGGAGGRGQEAGDRKQQGKSGSLSVFVATRRDIFLFHDDDGDLKADRKERIVRLETPGDYPHNALAGFAFDAMGWMYFGFGENLGADYKITGSDGTTLSGGGEGGHMYRCRPDGSKLKQWATGFWNPHASCVDAFGRLFTVDNDPDSRPPCRLLHIIEGGDYGFRFSNGRKGLHPFTSWNGEIPGTLPMVSGTGEAPSGIVAYESDGLPKKYIGNLLVTSWGDHRIDRFVLEPKGASFQSRPEALIQGGENFRPVGLAVAPDGSMYCTDWVLRDYKLHGKGRVWRISAVEEPKRDVVDAGGITEAIASTELKKNLGSLRMDVRRASAANLSKTENGRAVLLSVLGDRELSQRQRIEALWTLMQVPRETQQFDLGSSEVGENLFKTIDDVYLSAATFIGTPQLKLSASELEKLFDGEESKAPLARKHFLSMHLIEHFLPTYNLTGVGWFLLSESDDPFLQTLTRRKILQLVEKDVIADLILNRILDGDQIPLTFYLVARQVLPRRVSIIKRGLAASRLNVRRAAVQWAAEEKMTELRPQVEAVLNDKNLTTDLFLATLAALEMLDGVDPKDIDKTPASKYVLPLLKDAKRSAAVKRHALRLVEPDDPALDDALFAELLASGDAGLQEEAVRSLQLSSRKSVARLLTPVAADESAPLALRAEAVAGLTGRWFDSEDGGKVRELLLSLVGSDEPVLKNEAIRAARTLLTKTARGRVARVRLVRELESAKGANSSSLQAGGKYRTASALLALALSEARMPIPEVLKPVLADRPVEAKGWYETVNFRKGDALAGRRIFFHLNGVGCGKCHRINGRGGDVGPDLSVISRTMDRKKLAESILEPSREIAPQFTNWTFVMESGKVHQGMILGDTRDDLQRIGTSDGTVLELKANEIELRQPQKTSVMPEKLTDRLTVSEFQDLLSYLEGLK